MAKRLGVSEQSIYGWRSRFADMATEDVKEHKNLTQENARLKRLLAERDLEIEITKRSPQTSGTSHKDRVQCYVDRSV
ncbi:MAG: transposase [Herminiimonas sp.]|nr:transposase [Herminiimonas sp.]